MVSVHWPLSLHSALCVFPLHPQNNPQRKTIPFHQQVNRGTEFQSEMAGIERRAGDYGALQAVLASWEVLCMPGSY